MLDWTDCPQVEREEGKLGGAWVFRGTRVPMRALFENLEEGATVYQFLEWFPGVTHEQAVAVLAYAEQSLAKVKKTEARCESFSIRAFRYPFVSIW